MVDQARASVSDFLSRDGKHDTSIHETFNPAITRENVTPIQHENIQTAVDREVHQDHHHTSVQPIKDREVMPEQHTHKMAGVEHRNIKHGTDDQIKQRLAAEQSQFKNTRSVGDVQRSSSANPTVSGEHVHHHVHENIQPVVQKETVQPSVVHTTVPVHEVHQNEPKHHNATQLPPVTMDEFKKQGGRLSGREERTDAFGGEPKTVGGTLDGVNGRGTTSMPDGDSAGHGSRGGNNMGMNGNNSTSNNSTGNNSNGNKSIGNKLTGNKLTGNKPGGNKPSLIDKLNPMTDADGDGKAGFMK